MRWILGAVLILPFALWIGGINGLSMLGAVCVVVGIGSCVRRAT